MTFKNVATSHRWALWHVGILCYEQDINIILTCKYGFRIQLTSTIDSG